MVSLLRQDPFQNFYKSFEEKDVFTIMSQL